MTTPPSTDTDTDTDPNKNTDPGAGPDATAPYTLGRRLAAACGLLFLLACLVFTGMITLRDAIEGDGSGGVFIAAGFWALALGAVAGVAALAVPRRALVTAQYCLGAAGPLLALID
ncbi:hypothetical protein AMK27_22475 [Streptomyces sp. CB02009]|uniref:hypothetical protein n=1 Tax=Streptomyces sp. CB02009 TaxID=1703938 RepID=UPI00093887C8|nr:hypothetical protein [Streptomyces sp. CB02009]OKJ60196.1 hypothetical protein AMK27_22475 [Streptomyces sp. CB02009]